MGVVAQQLSESNSAESVSVREQLPKLQVERELRAKLATDNKEQLPCSVEEERDCLTAALKVMGEELDTSRRKVSELRSLLGAITRRQYETAEKAASLQRQLSLTELGTPSGEPSGELEQPREGITTAEPGAATQAVGRHAVEAAAEEAAAEGARERDQLRLTVAQLEEELQSLQEAGRAAAEREEAGREARQAAGEQAESEAKRRALHELQEVRGHLAAAQESLGRVRESEAAARAELEAQRRETITAQRELLQLRADQVKSRKIR